LRGNRNGQEDSAQLMYPVWWVLGWPHWLQGVFIFAEKQIWCNVVTWTWETVSQSRGFALCLTLTC